MIVAVFGTPTALTYVGCAIVKTIAESVSGPHHQIAAVLTDDLRKAWSDLPADKRKQIVIVSDLPSSPLLDLVRSSRAPTIVFLDEFEEIVNQLVETRGMALRPAVRHATQVLCAIDQVRDEDALRILVRDSGHQLKALIASLCEFFGLAAAAEVTGDVMTRLGYAASDTISLRDHIGANVPQPVSPESVVAWSDGADRAMLKFMAKQYAQVGTGAPVPQIAWPTSIFLQVNPPQDYLEGATELVGPARILSYGPYLHLPKGNWTVSVTIEVAENFSGNRLLVDVAAISVLAAGEAPLPVSGAFGLDLSFEILDPFVAVEVRCQILSGAIEGKLALRDVVFRRTPKSLE